MANPDKLATQGTRTGRRKTKQKRNTIFYGHYAQANTYTANNWRNIIKTNRASFLCENHEKLVSG